MRKLIEEYGMTLLYIIVGLFCIGLFMFAFFGEESSLSKVVNTSIEKSANQDVSIVYTITYKGMDGATFGEQEVPSTYTRADRVFLPIPSKEGYLFAGWTGTRLTKPTINAVIPEGSTGNRTFTATWTKGYYRIVYNNNVEQMVSRYNGITSEQMVHNWMNGTMTSQLAEYGNYPTFASSGFTFKGHEFLGWSTNPSATKGDTLYRSGASAVSDLLENNTVSWTVNEITLYAIWEEKIYTIDYISDGKAAAIDGNNPANYTITDRLELNGALREGYEFDGWYTRDPYLTYNHNENYLDYRLNKENAPDYDVIPVGTIGNLILYPHWHAKTYTVTFDANLPEGANLSEVRGMPESRSVLYDHAYSYIDNETNTNLPTIFLSTEIEEPEHAYKYYFKGWYLESECIHKVENADIVKTASDHTLYAGWRATAYTVKLHSNY